MQETVVQVRNANIYQGSNLILKDVNFTVSRGEFVFLVGKTGTGKSSLLKTLYGELPFTEGEVSVAKVTQLPLRLAWALTIHKSQGKTFSQVVIDIDRGTFASGQMYVALSRCTTLQGIVLRSPLVNDNIMVDPRVIEFARSEQEEDELQHLLDDGARRAASLQLQKVFSFTDMIATITALRPDIAKRKTGPKEQNMLLMDKVLTGLHKAQDTATRFGRQIEQLTAERRDDELLQRKQAAVTYFCNEVLSPLLILVEAHFKVLDEHPKVAKQTRTFKEMKTLLQLKEKDLLELLPAIV